MTRQSTIQKDMLIGISLNLGYPQNVPLLGGYTSISGSADAFFGLHKPVNIPGTIQGILVDPKYVKDFDKPWCIIDDMILQVWPAYEGYYPQNEKLQISGIIQLEYSAEVQWKEREPNKFSPVLARDFFKYQGVKDCVILNSTMNFIDNNITL